MLNLVTLRPAEVLRNGVVHRRHHRLEGDPGGARVQGGPSGAEEGGGRGGRVLQISGERKKEHEEKNDRWHRVERSSGRFRRRFRLPKNAKVDQVKAAMENGVLTVTVPKEEVKKPVVKAIDISG
ncbi:hypothetical protein RJ639_032328 [Escallonia herrerae]|uniref:SHSP domain-containing protein n=1 Tax=Escallonia herrerae TaxID=1293975 RepID=A0AA88X126_9ASTE|nr:hypothetical protein RJ639_032328 [Escallonia herrerae]